MSPVEFAPVSLPSAGSTDIGTTHTSFDRLLISLRQLADSKRMQGNYFEELVRHFLVQDATSMR